MKNQSLASWAFSLCAIGVSSAAWGATELAKINGSTLSLEDFTRRYAESQRVFQMKPVTKQRILDEIINREIAIQEAKKEGLDRDPEIQDRIGTVLFQSLLEKKLKPEIEKIHVTDADAKSFYSRNPEIRTSNIFVAVPAEAKPEEMTKAKERIESAEKALKEGKMSFAEVAQKFSEGPSAPIGGDIDYQAKDKLDPAYYEAAVALRSPGKNSGIVRSQFGYHIIRLTAVRPWEEADQNQAKRLVFQEKRDQLVDQYLSQLRKKASVSVRSELLKK